MNHWFLEKASSEPKLGFLRSLPVMMIVEGVESHGERMRGTCKNSNDQVSQSKRYQL